MAKKTETVAKNGKNISVRQCRSSAGYDKRTKLVLAALGLGRIGSERNFVANPALLGQIARVSHLVSVTEA